MRNICIGILIGLMIAAPFAFTQTAPETITIEVPLQIGMPKEAAINRLAEQGLTLTKLKDKEIWIVSKRNEQAEYEVIGSVSFDRSHLSLATRSWASTSTDTEGAKLARNFYSLIRSFETSGNKSCVIDTRNWGFPDYDHRELGIHCGKRTATLDVNVYNKGALVNVNLDETIK
jgi:hypothetical protein